MKKILVIGDLILDEYVTGESYKMSDEAPVPILKVDRFVPKLGGAANVANNIKSLGGDVLLCGAIGESGSGLSASRFIKALSDANLSDHYIIQGGMKTTTKSRVIINNQQVARFDYEDSTIPKEVKEDILDKLRYLDFSKISIIVVSDYKKGVISSEVMEVLKLSGLKIIIDPKPTDDKIYNGAYCMTPNLREFNLFNNSDITDTSIEELKNEAKKYIKKLSLDSIVVTLGKLGALCCSDEFCEIVPNHIIEVANTIGAGDTFVSALSLKLSEGKDLVKSVKIANAASSIVVSKKYTGVCTMTEIEKLQEQERNG